MVDAPINDPASCRLTGYVRRPGAGAVKGNAPAPAPATFQEATGLEQEVEVVEYRGGASPNLFPVKMAAGSVTFTRGTIVGDPAFLTWLNSIQAGTHTRSTLLVSLIDTTGSVKYTWTLNHAFPTQYHGTDLKSASDEVAVESLEVAYEYLTVGS